MTEVEWEGILKRKTAVLAGLECCISTIKCAGINFRARLLEVSGSAKPWPRICSYGNLYKMSRKIGCNASALYVITGK